MTKKADYSMLWQSSDRMSMDRRLPAGNHLKFSYRRTGNNDKTQRLKKWLLDIRRDFKDIR